MLKQYFFKEHEIFVYMPGSAGAALRRDAETRVQVQIGNTAPVPAELSPVGQIAPTGIHTILLMDNSFSIAEENRDMIQQVASELVQSHRPGERFSLYSFDRELRTIAEGSTDYQQLEQSIGQIEYRNQDSYLKNALYTVLNRIGKDHVLYQRLIVFCDGSDDQEIGYTYGEITALAKEKGCPIYVIGSRFEDSLSGLESLFACSRESTGQGILLDQMTDPAEAAEPLQADLPSWIAAAEIPAELMDGSRKNIRITAAAESGESQLLMEGEVSMPFAEPETESEAEAEELQVTEELQEQSALQEPSTLQAEGTLQAETETSADTGSGMPSGNSAANGIQPLLILGVLVFLGLLLAAFNVRRKRKEKNSPNPLTGQEPAEESAPTVLLHTEDHPTEYLTRTGSDTVVLIPEGDYNRKIECSCREQISIGRNPKCDVCIPDDTSVSGIHCIIFYNRRRELQVRDNHSSNGTFLNQHRLINAHPLETGDILEVGRTRYHVQVRKGF